jgi:uncharacterized membrane protein
MRSHLRLLCVLGLSAVLAAMVVLAQPEPPRAQANVACDLGSGPAAAVTGGIGAITGGAIGGGNPVGDTCNEVTDGAVGALTSPIEGAIEGLGNSIFGQITDWASEGAAWLIGRVVELTEETTTPKLTTPGFLKTYGQMALIGGLLAAAMLLAAVLEGIAQGNMGMLVRVVGVNLPLAFIATSVAYAIVQMALIGTDGLCHAIGAASQESSQHFFHGAIAGLGKAGGSAGETVGATGSEGPSAGKAAGETAVPLFVSFLAAIVGGFAAFFVWIELLMRDAAVYVVALFMPLALAASIWPRWSGALRRTGELLAVVIGSKFVIVSIIALAAGLVSESSGRVEHVLAAAALMALACFSPFVLFRLVPIAEGAVGAAYGRRHAAASTMGGARNISSSAQSVQRAARSSWGGGSGANGGGKGSGGAGARGAATGKAGAGGAGAASAKGAVGAGAAGAAAGGVALAGSLPVAAARGAQGAAGKLAQSGTAQAAGASGGASAPAQPQRPGSESSATTQTPSRAEGSKAKSAGQPPRSAASSNEDGPRGGGAPASGSKPARPPAELSRRRSGKEK